MPSTPDRQRPIRQATERCGPGTSRRGAAPAAGSGRAPRLAPALVALLALVLGCTTPDARFAVPAAQLRAEVGRVAVLPALLEVEVARPDAVRDRIDALVAARLREGGWTVLPDEVSRRAWVRRLRSVGSIVDPRTGRVDPARWLAVARGVHADLVARYDVDAVLHARVAAVEAYLVGETSWLCGAALETWWPGEDALDAAAVARAACLRVDLYGGTGRRLYRAHAGLEVIETVSRQIRSIRPVEERLQDPGRIRAAVEIAVGPLADAGGGG